MVNAVLRSEIDTELTETTAINDPSNIKAVIPAKEDIVPNCLRSTMNRFADPKHFSSFSGHTLDTVRQFHRGLPGYQSTPLYSLDNLAEQLGIGKILVKDEGQRFDVNAFKVLGGSYSVARLLAKEFNLTDDELDLDTIRSKIKEPMTFATATDGNHGRGIAWAANKLGQKAVIYMPVGTAIERVCNIEALGATVHVTDMNYDDTVRLACEQSELNKWEFVQDTAWDGYTEIPLWIMQGYTTIVSESIEQMAQMGEKPTHILLQAGVGSMAGAMLASFGQHYGPDNLTSLVLEPYQADCVYRSALHKDGDIVVVDDMLNTIMAGLACGEPSTIGWEILKANATAFMSCDDSLAATGMRVLASPTGNDPAITSGESGAIGTGVLYALAQKEEGRKLMEKLGIGKDSVVWVLNTEGNTDPVNYQKVVWEGKFPMAE